VDGRLKKQQPNTQQAVAARGGPRCAASPPGVGRHPSKAYQLTLMHLSGVPVAVIAAWIGHKDAGLTMRLYAHSQADALKAAGVTLDRVVSPSCH
jgi:hypothetical protein